MKIIAFLVITMLTLKVFAQGTDLTYKEGETTLKGYLVKPTAKQEKVPGVVIVHAWKGITDFEKGVAGNLGGLGYMAIAADIYGEGIRPVTTDEAGKQSGYYKTHRDIYRKRIQAAIDELVNAGADPDKIVVIGYCFGGIGALEAARAGMKVRAIVSLHGGLDRDSTIINAQAISTKVLVLHGADDPFIPKQQIEAFQNEMRTTRADWQMVYYANAVHAFTMPGAGNDNSKGAAYNATAAKRSWEHMELFLKEAFE